MLAGIDIGTQSLKVVITDGDLTRLGEGSRAYMPEFPAPNRAEQSPRIWEQALGPAIVEALQQARVSPRDIQAIAIAGQLDGCLPVRSDGEPLGNCLIWMDRRAGESLEDVDRDAIHSKTGVVADPSHLAAKARWLKRRMADASATCAFHQPVSYMVERLTGARVIDHALASTSMLYALEDRRYDDHLLAAFGLSSDELPPIAEAYEIAGVLTGRGAELTGLPRGIKVAVGTGDDFSTALGAGIWEPGRLSVAIGTGEVVGCLFRKPAIDPHSLVETHAYPAGNYFVENPGWLAGGAVTWLMGVLDISSFEEFESVAAAAPAGSEGVLFLPALTGAMAPEWIAEARGCFYGLTAMHGRAHLARALLEGCSFAMRDVAERLVSMGATPALIQISGGGSRSRLWAQIRADTLRMPAAVVAYPHTSPMGAVMLAAVAAGVCPTLADACARIPRPTTTIEPNLTSSNLLDGSYGRYRSLFSALKPFFGAVTHAPHRQ